MSWFRNLLNKKNSSNGSSGNVASPTTPSSSTSSATVPPPLPPRRPSHSRHSTQGSMGSMSAATSAPFVPDARAALLENLMSDYAKQSNENHASQKLQQLLDIAMPMQGTQLASSGSSFMPSSSPPTSSSSFLPRGSPPQSNNILLGTSASFPITSASASLLDEASLKRNTALIPFLASASGRLADRVSALTGSIGSGGTRASIAANTPLNAALADKQAGRWLALLNQFAPFPSPALSSAASAAAAANEAYGVRLLELLRLLAWKDEKRIATVNANRLTSVILQCVHALAEMHPTTFAHIAILEKGSDSALGGGISTVGSGVEESMGDPSRIDRHERRHHHHRHGGRRRHRDHHHRGADSSSGSDSPSSGLRSHSDSRSEASDFELESAPAEELSANNIAMPHDSPSDDATGTNATSSSLTSNQPPRTAAEYAKLPLMQRICHLQSLFMQFLSSIAHAIPTSLELVRSNTLVMLIRMCVGGVQQANQALNNNPNTIGGGTLATNATTSGGGFAYAPPSAGRCSYTDASFLMGSIDDAVDAPPLPDDVDPHSVPPLLYHAQLLALHLLLNLMKSKPCLDIKVCQYLSKASCLKILLSMLRPTTTNSTSTSDAASTSTEPSSGFPAHRPSTLVDLLQCLVQILEDSSNAQREGLSGTLSYNLFDEFATLQGYDSLLKTTLWVRTLTLQAHAERVQARKQASANPLSVALSTPSAPVTEDEEDACALCDNPFLNPASHYPCMPALVSPAFSSSSLESRNSELQGCMSRLLELLHSLIFISPHMLKVPIVDDIPNHSQMMLSGFASEMDPDTPVSPELRVKNLDGVRLLLFAFVKCPLISLRQEILNRMLLIYSGHPDNLWLLHELHPLTYFIEMIPHLSLPDSASVPPTPASSSSGLHLQKLVWRLIEYIVNVRGVVPLQEITTIGLILRVRTPNEKPAAESITSNIDNEPTVASKSLESQRRQTLLAFESSPSLRSLSSLRTLLLFHDAYPNNDSIRLILNKIQELIEEHSAFRDVFRQSEIISILIQHLHQLATYLDAKEKINKSNLENLGAVAPADASSAVVIASSVHNRKASSSTVLSPQEIVSLKPLLIDTATFELCLRTMQLLLTSSPVNARLFREYGGSHSLFSCLKYEPYRAASLSLLACQLDAANFQEILENLQSASVQPVVQIALIHTLIRMLSNGVRSASSNAGLNASALAAAQALATDSFVLPPSSGTGSSGNAATQAASEAASARIKDTYRTLAGFESIFSLLSRLDRIFSPKSDRESFDVNMQQWAILEGILCIINLSITGHPRNREYVWSYSNVKNYTWKALAYSIKLSGILQSFLVGKLIQSVMNLATETPQLPSSVIIDKTADEKAIARDISTLQSSPSEQQPWVFQFPLNSDVAATKATSTANAITIWPSIPSPDAILVLIRILTDCRLDVQVSGLSSLNTLVSQATRSGHLGLRNLEVLCNGGVLEYFLVKFGKFLNFANASNSSGAHLAEDSKNCDLLAQSLKEEYDVNPIAHMPVLSVESIKQLLQHRSWLVQQIIEGLSFHRISTSELKIFIQILQQNSMWDKMQKMNVQDLKSLINANSGSSNSVVANDSCAGALAETLNPDLHVYQFLLRLLYRSQWSSTGGDFIEFDLRTSSNISAPVACMDVPSFGRNSWPVSGVFAFASWVHVRSFANEPVDAIDLMQSGGNNNRASVSPLLQLFEFTSGESHLWSASILPNGFLLVSSGSITAKGGVENSIHALTPWRQANLDQLEEKGPGQGQALFEKYRFQPYRWTHVALCHEKAKGQNRVLLSLYVDGNFVQQVQVQCAPSTNTSSVVSARGYIGVPPPIVPPGFNSNKSVTTPPTQSNLVWWMNGIYFFNTLLTPTEIHLMYRRGPGYTGSFLPQHASLKSGGGGGGILSRKSTKDTSESLERAGSSGSTGGGVLNPSWAHRHRLDSHFSSSFASGVSTSGLPTTSSFSAAAAAAASIRKENNSGDNWIKRMEGERQFLYSRCNFDPRKLDDTVPASSNSNSSNSASGSLSSSSNSSSSFVGSSADTNFFDSDKVVFSFGAHHVVTLKEQYANESQNAAFAQSSNSASNGDSNSGSSTPNAANVQSESDENAMRTMLAYAESADPGLVLPNTCSSALSTASRILFPVTYLRGGASPIHPLSFASTIRRAGGMAALIAVLQSEEVRSATDVLLVLSLLFASLKDSSANMKEMARIGGYHLVSSILYQKKHLLSVESMQVMFAFIEGGASLFSLIEPWKLLQVGGAPALNLLPVAMREFDFMQAPASISLSTEQRLCYEESHNSTYTHVWIHATDKRNERVSATNDTSKSIVANPIALEQFLLNFALWDSCSLALKQNLLARLQQLCLVGPSREQMVTHFRNYMYAPSMVNWLAQSQQQYQNSTLIYGQPIAELNDGRNWNANRIRACGGIPALFALAQSMEDANPLLSAITASLEVLILDDLPLKDLRAVAAFLVRGLEKNANVNSSTANSANTKPKPLPGCFEPEPRYGYLIRSSDSSAPISPLLQLGESMFCILAKVVYHATQRPHSIEKEWSLNSLGEVLDAHFFSLFLWSDVHPRIITASMHLINVLLCHSNRFRDQFRAPVNATLTTYAMPNLTTTGAPTVPPLLPSAQVALNAAVGGSNSNASVPASPASTPITPGVIVGGSSNVSPPTASLVVPSSTTSGFLMLLERVPYCRPNIEVLHILLGILFGKQAFPALTRLAPNREDFTPDGLAALYLTDVIAPPTGAVPPVTRAPSFKSMTNFKEAPKSPPANPLVHVEALQVILALMRFSCAELLAFQEGVTAESTAASATPSSGGRNLTSPSNKDSTKEGALELLSPIAPNCSPLTTEQYVSFSSRSCAISHALVQFFHQHVFPRSVDFQVEIFQHNHLDKLIDMLFVCAARCGRNVDIQRDMAVAVNKAAPPNCAGSTALSVQQIHEHTAPLLDSLVGFLRFLFEYALIYDISSGAFSTNSTSSISNNSAVFTPVVTTTSSSSSGSLALPETRAAAISTGGSTFATPSMALSYSCDSDKVRRILESYPIEIARSQVQKFQQMLLQTALESIQTLLKNKGGVEELMQKGPGLPELPGTQSVAPVPASDNGSGVILFHKLHNLLIFLIWKLEHSQLDLAYGSSSHSSSSPSLFISGLDAQRIVEFGVVILQMAFGTNATSASSARPKLTQTTVDEVCAHLQQLFLYFLAEAKANGDNELLIYLLQRLYTHAKVLIPSSGGNFATLAAVGSTSSLQNQSVRFVQSVIYHLYSYFTLMKGESADTLSESTKQQLENIQLCGYSIWNNLLNNHLHVLQDILIHNSTETKMSYDLLAGGFSNLMAIPSDSSAGNLPGILFTMTSNPVQKFDTWLRIHIDEVTVVFEETVFVAHRSAMEKEVRARLTTRNQISGMWNELSVDRRRKRKKILERRTALHTQRLLSLSSAHASSSERYAALRRESSYRQFEMNRTMKGAVSALQKGSILFNWVNEQLMTDMQQQLALQSAASALDPTSMRRQFSSPLNSASGLPSSFDHTAANINQVQVLNSRTPLPYRSNEVSLFILSDWIRRGYLPTQRFELDLTEGPLRQRKKMSLQEDFYLNYKIHIPRLQKALVTLEAKHAGLAIVSDNDESEEKVDDQKQNLESKEHDATPASPTSASTTSSTNTAGGKDDKGESTSAAEDAQRQLMEELPQLSLSMLTQITAHANAAANAAANASGSEKDGETHARHKRRTSSRRYSANILLQMGSAGKDGSGADGGGVDQMSPVAEVTSPLADAATPVDRPPSLKIDADDDSGSSSDEEEPAGPVPPPIPPKPKGLLSPRRAAATAAASTVAEEPDTTQSEVSTTNRASSLNFSREASLVSTSEDLASSPNGGAENENEDEEEFSLVMRRDALTRARSLATGGSQTQKKPATDLSVSTTAADSTTAALSTPAAIEEEGAPISVELDEYEKILRLLEPGDDVLPGGLYACSRVTGLDKIAAVVVLCAHHLYVIDHFTFSAEGQLISLDPSQSLVGTLPPGTDPTTNEPLFHVEVTARPVSTPWVSEDSQKRSLVVPQEADPVEKSPVPPLSAEDIVLHVSKVTKQDEPASTKNKKSGDKGSSGNKKDDSVIDAAHSSMPPQDDPEDPITDPSTDRDDNTSLWKIRYTSLRDIHKRRYSLMALGLEFFSHDGVTMLLVFETPEERDQVHTKILNITATEVQTTDRVTPDMGMRGLGGSLGHITPSGLDLSFSMQGQAAGLVAPSHARMRAWRKNMCGKWQRGEISNFAYLMFLNTFAGRSYLDFTSYPVFPWILSDYTSPTLALDDERVYRDLSKPMGAIGDDRAKLFQGRYQSWDDPTGTVPPFHYGTHYSSAATVLYYLIRLEPFTKYNLHLQGGKFDHADRLFFDLNHTWTSASSQGGLSDVKELIPEFFYLPDFLKNSNRFDLGEHQRGGYVGDVKLPPWALGDPRIFIRLHRKALESSYVSAHLHEWIDLIFGFKQRGKPAIKAQNVFYYLTYEDVVDVNAITDPLQKAATCLQIQNFGQTPHQIFRKPHPTRNPIPQAQRVTISSHPQLLHPAPSSSSAMPVLPRQVACIYWSGKQDKLFCLDENKTVVPGSLTKYISWGHADHSLRFHILQTSPRHRTQDEIVAVHEGMHDGAIRTTSITEDGQCILTGGADGLVKLWRLHPEFKHKQLLLTKTLHGHWSPITAITHAWSYSLLLTAAEDGQVLFWDMNKLSLQRKLPLHPAPVHAMAIDLFRGDVVTCAGPNIYVWDVNGEMVAEFLGSVAPSETIESVTWSQGAEGAWVEPNIITGHRDGSIRIWRLVYPSAVLDPASAEALSPANSMSAIRRKESIAGAMFSSSSFTASTPSNATTSASSPSVVQSFDLRSRLDSFPRQNSSQDPHKSAPTTPAAPAAAPAPAARPLGSLGVGFLTIELCHRLEAVHDSAVTVLHTSPADWRRLWSGDKFGRTVCWQISSEEHWTKDSEAKNCQACQVKFSVLERRHHCRECGFVYCSKCSSHRIPLEHLGFMQSVRVCDSCFERRNPLSASNANKKEAVSPNK